MRLEASNDHEMAHSYEQLAVPVLNLLAMAWAGSQEIALDPELEEAFQETLLDLELEED